MEVTPPRTTWHTHNDSTHSKYNINVERLCSLTPTLAKKDLWSASIETCGVTYHNQHSIGGRVERIDAHVMLSIVLLQIWSSCDLRKQ